MKHHEAPKLIHASIWIIASILAVVFATSITIYTYNSYIEKISGALEADISADILNQ